MARSGGGQIDTNNLSHFVTISATSFTQVLSETLAQLTEDSSGLGIHRYKVGHCQNIITFGYTPSMMAASSLYLLSMIHDDHKTCSDSSYS